MLTVTFGIWSTISRIQVQLRYNRFEEGQKDVNDDTHSGRMTTSTNDEAVMKMILDSPRITIREIADDFGILRSYGI